VARTTHLAFAAAPLAHGRRAFGRVLPGSSPAPVPSLLLFRRRQLDRTGASLLVAHDAAREGFGAAVLHDESRDPRDAHAGPAAFFNPRGASQSGARPGLAPASGASSGSAVPPRNGSRYRGPRSGADDPQRSQAPVADRSQRRPGQRTAGVSCPPLDHAAAR